MFADGLPTIRMSSKPVPSFPPLDDDDPVHVPIGTQMHVDDDDEEDVVVVDDVRNAGKVGNAGSDGGFDGNNGNLLCSGKCR